MKTRITLALAIAAAMPLIAHADAPGQHPAYKHALSDLEDAQKQIAQRPAEDGAVSRDEQTIKDELAAAIDDIHKADVIVQKKEEVPAPDAGKLPDGRLHAAIALMQHAKANLSSREDNPSAQEEQRHAVDHIEKALNASMAVIKDPKKK